MRRLTLALAILLYALPAAAQSGWNLTFSDEFNASSLDASKWGTQYTWGCTNNDEQEGYEPGNVSLANGNAVLTATNQPNSCNGGKSYSSGMIESAGKFSQLYGYFEARIQVPAFQGFWPAFWLMPANGSWPPETDVIELGQGGDFMTARMTPHWPSNSYQEQDWSNTGTPFGLAMHTFAIDWEPGTETWYIDGIARATFTGSNVPTIPMYILANLAVGGSWPGPPNGTTPLPSHMLVDYIRVYTHPANGAGCYATIPAPGTIPSTSCGAVVLPAPQSNLTVTVQ